MQRLLSVGFVWLVCCMCASAEVLTNKLAVTAASSAMHKAGYAKTGLQMMPHAGEDLQFWEVGEGVLIIRYSKASLKIVGMTFSVADAQPKALRKSFDFDVASFDTSTGTMTIHTKKGDQAETNRTSSAAASRRSP